jgi:hypothetical protein
MLYDVPCTFEITSGLSRLKLRNSFAAFFRLASLKKFERPLVFLHFFASPDEKIQQIIAQF